MALSCSFSYILFGCEFNHVVGARDDLRLLVFCPAELPEAEGCSCCDVDLGGLLLPTLDEAVLHVSTLALRAGGSLAGTATAVPARRNWSRAWGS